jgi:GNAT superfamily N-acetyltransferase
MMIREVAYDHPDAAKLIDQVQQFYVRIYGGPDTTPVDPGEFARPRGAFFLGYDEDDPVAMGGWRLADRQVLGRMPAEIKRMYVVEGARGRGLARGILSHLEQTAAAAGADAMVLETGRNQPAAVALYRSAAYIDIPRFGYYADAPDAVHLGKILHPAGEV